MNRKFGWHPERASFRPRRLLADLLRTEDVSPPPSYLICKREDVHVLDQGETGSCVAQSGSQCLRSFRLGQHDLDPPMPSVLWGYRCRETHHDGDRDDGTYLSAYHRYIDDLGWCTEKHWPWNVDQINARAHYSTRLHAYDQRNTVQEYAVPSDKHTCMAAIATGHPLHCGQPITRAWFDYDARNGLTTLEDSGPDIGGHAYAVLGYDEQGVVAVNSWGTDWGFGGWFRLGWDTFLDRCRDRYAIRYVRRATT
jgi:C1A family cysteine protease